MKPMLAAATDGTCLTYPLLASPKLDGVRALVIDGVVMSRSLKPIPNLHVQKCFGRGEFNGLDGELIVGDPWSKDAFRVTSSSVTAIQGRPEVTFHVFDDFSNPSLGFSKRFEAAAKRHAKLRYGPVDLVFHSLIHDEMELQEFECSALEQGYEGVMVRSLDGLYKEGRSTLKQGWLLKLKRFSDGEAEIIGFHELMHNTNTAEINELGYQARSSKKAGLIGKGCLGAFTVRDLKTKVEFDVGTGFTQAEREAFWAARQTLLGKLVKYKHFSGGVKDKPRFPVFLGFRDLSDL